MFAGGWGAIWEAISFSFEDFLEAGGAFGDLWGHPRPRTSFFNNFGMILDASGGALEHHVDPIGRPRGLNLDVFLTTSVRNPVFHYFWVAKREQKRCISREPDVIET